MKRFLTTAVLLGLLGTGGMIWQQASHAEGPAATASASEPAPSGPEGVQIADGPHAEAIRDLLASEPGPERDAAVRGFRDLGPDAFAALYQALAPTIEQYRAFKQFGLKPSQMGEAAPLVRLLDTVAKQRDAYAAGLYWYTDLDAAKEQARATGRPILSLRMLGNLDEEYSCANSRFFRTALYADAELSQKLRENFVLHWHSVRPVPVIIIDMGDGRVIRRTITGNSCHVVMDADGRAMDVIPGLYGPRLFEEHITRLSSLAEQLDGMEAERRVSALHDYHQRAAEALDQRWAELTGVPVLTINLSQTNGNLRPLPGGLEGQAQIHPDALIAAKVAVGKGLVERPVLTAISAAPPTPAAATDELWDRVAATYAENASLDAASRALLREKTITAEQAMRMALSKSRVEDPLLAMVQNFEGAIALDTARNEHLLHREIHRWFVAGEVPVDDPTALTSRVYAELFLTPDEDPWLGLVPADTYSALDQGGLEVCEMP